MKKVFDLFKVDPKVLEEMLSKLKTIEMATKEIKNKNSNKMIDHKQKIEEEEDIDDFDEEIEKSD